MLKIAIADDQRESADKARAIADHVYRLRGEEYVIEIFENPETLLVEIREKESYDIYLLDIEMPGLDGRMLAEEINRNFPHSYIIFITSHLEYAPDCYELNIYRYIAKAQIETKLPRALTAAAVDIRREANSFYIIHSTTKYEKIFLQDVIYLRKQEKNTIFVTIYGEYRDRKKLGEVYQEVKLPNFIYINRGNIININHIVSLSKVVLTMSNGEKLTVSKSRLDDVKQKINAYWRESITL